MPPKKKEVNLNVILIDANSTANAVSPSGSTHFDTSEGIADSILCQKIFSDSTDKCAVIAFGFDRFSHGCHVINEMERANFFAIEKLEEVKPGTNANVPVQKGLEFAINQIKDFCRENPNTSPKAKIYLLSNMESTPAATLTPGLARQVAKALKDEGIELIVGSPDEVVNDDKSPKIKFMGVLGAEAEAKWLSFSQCQNLYEPILPRNVAPRGMPFDLKLDTNIDIKLQMFKKNDKSGIKHNFTFCSSDGQEEVKKHFQHTTRPDIQIEMDDVDMIEDAEIIEGKYKKAEESKKVLDKEDLIKAFYYGKTAVPIDEDLKDEFRDVKLGKELRLIQFTIRDNILPQFIMSSPRYLLPVKDTYGSQKVFQSLVMELLEKNLVAIARYAYNVNSSARIVCLIPKITKSGMPMFIHYQIPYGDDIRTYEFAYLDTEENQPDDFQKDAIDAFVEELMIPDDEHRPKNTPHPRLQNESLILRQKALDPGDPIKPYQFSAKSLRQLRMSDEKYEVAAALQDAFNLQPIDEKRSKVFGDRPMGVDPIDYKESADENVTTLAKKEEK